MANENGVFRFDKAEPHPVLSKDSESQKQYHANSLLLNDSTAKQAPIHEGKNLVHIYLYKKVPVSPLVEQKTGIDQSGHIGSISWHGTRRKKAGWPICRNGT